jgi:hypothetical protein
MKGYARFVSALIVSVLLFTQVCAANAATVGNVAAPQSAVILKKALPDLSGSDLAKALAIAEKYYKLAVSKATQDEKTVIAAAILWKPDFTGKTTNAAMVGYMNYQSAFLTGYTDLKGAYLALDSALFALDVKNVTSAGNLASAILAYAEDTNKKPLASISAGAKSNAEDALAVYEYALSLELKKQFLDAGSLPLLLNYGNVCMDTGKLPAAKTVFETAVKIAPDYLPAKKGMAAYWLAAGNKEKAKKALEGGLIPAYYKKMKQTGEDTTEKKAPEVKAEDSIPTMEEKIETLRKVPLVVATDFYADLDPEGTANVKKFVDGLAAKWKYKAPEYKYLSQYSPLKNFVSGSGQAAFEAFQNQMTQFMKEYSKKQLQANQDVLGNLGLGITGVDINDMINNPEKYDGYDSGQAQVTGLDQLMGRLQDMMGQAAQAQEGLKNGDASGAVNLGASVDPSLKIFTMNPGDYANPTDILTQKYNMTVLNRKMLAYQNYFIKQQKEMDKVLKEDSQKLATQLTQLKKGLSDALGRIDHTRHGDQPSPCPVCIRETHAAHQTYDLQMNNVSETTWMDATTFVNTRYVQKLKPNIEAMYADCMRNIMLISDTKARKVKEDRLYSDVYQYVQMSMNNVLMAYGLKDSGYPFHCDCTEEELAAAAEMERKAYQEKMAAKAEKEAKAKADFYNGIIPESSQLYKNLDKYSANLNMMFMQAKWHPVKTEVAFSVKASNKGFGEKLDKKPNLEAGATFKIIQNHIVNTTTYKAGLSSSVSVTDGTGALGAKATVGVQGEVTYDANGNVTYADVVGTASGSVTAGPVKATGTYETSVMRGNKWSGEVAETYNDSLRPPGMSKQEKENWSQMTNAAKIFLPEKPKKVLWKGEYK